MSYIYNFDTKELRFNGKVVTNVKLDDVLKEHSVTFVGTKRYGKSSMARDIMRKHKVVGFF